MKSKIILAFGIVLMFSLLLLFVTVSETQASDKAIIVCTTSAVGSIVEEFLDDTAEVLVLVQPSLCPADFDMKPGCIDAVSKAQILFKQNIKGEFWLDGLLEAVDNPELTVVAIPGVFNTPLGAKSYIRRVGGNLSQILDLDLDSKISEMLRSVDEVSSLIVSQAETLDVSNVKVVCMSWLKSFIEHAGFTVVASYNPPETLSAGDISSLLDTAEDESVALVVDNLQIDTGFGAGIAAQVGAEHVVLTNFPGGVPSTETLPEMLKYNAEQLFSGTTTWLSTSTFKAEKVDLQNQLALFKIAASLAVIIAIVEAVLLYAKRKQKL